MRALLVLLVCVAAAVTANPLMLKKSINAKAIESVDQDLSVRAQNVDRAKKDVTFCVEVRDNSNKPVVVDCADRQPVNIQVVQPEVQPQQQQPTVPVTYQVVQPAVQPQQQQPTVPVTYQVGPAVQPQQQPTAPEPQPLPEQQPQQIVQPQQINLQPFGQPIQYGQPTIHTLGPVGTLLPNGQFSPNGQLSPGASSPSGPPTSGPPQVHTMNIEVPCQPEIAAYVVQPPQEIVYAPTGNCVPQLQNLQYSSAPAAPSQVLHLPSAPAASTTPTQVLHLPTGHHHAHQGHHPHHHHVVPAVAPAPVPATVPATVPASVQPAVHYHNGVQCTCHSAPGVFADSRSVAAAPMQSNEALAQKFLQDLQRNMANAGQQVMTLPKSAAAPSAATTMPMQTQYTSSPLISMQPQTLTIQPQSLTIPQAQVTIPQLQIPTASQLLYNGAARMKALEDSFTAGRVVPGLRAYRENGEEAIAAVAAQQQEAIPEEHKSPSEMIEQMKKNDKDDAKNPRIARFIMSKDEAENQVESN